MNDGLKHYGTPRHSGRYPWGSGDDPQRSRSFLQQVEELKKKGLSEVDIAKGFGMTTSQLRAKKTLAKAEQRKEDYMEALKLKNKGYSNVAIGEKMGINESSVRALLDPALQERSEITNTTSNMLRESVDKKGYIDVGVGVERFMGVSRTKLKTAISQLQDEGYLITYLPVEQLGTGKKTSVMVLSKPKNDDAVEVVKLKNKGLTEPEIAKQLKIDESSVTSLLKESYADVYGNKDKIRLVTDYSEDGGRSFLGLELPRSVDSNRIHIRYAEDGGIDRDGTIELRRGIQDISLGNARYAQVRISVDDTHYMKGMAMYTDDIPKGKDIIYNTNKSKDTPPEKVFKTMKPDMNDPKAKEIQSSKISQDEKEKLLKKGVEDGTIKPDPDNPFGATVKQRHYKDSKGKDQLSALNIINEEGEWRDKWSKSLSSQMLSKQTPALAKKQLGLAYDIKKEEFDEIISLTNPAVRKRLLDSFADDADSAAVHLKAAALPRSGWHALLPFPTMKPDQIYAPNFRDGEKVVLIRYPHGGLFEIPELTVNNKHVEAKNTIGRAKDAVGIHPKVAERLSGADFDGDSVLVIPNNNREVKYQAALKGLKDFDPKALYKLPDEAPKMSSRTKGLKMGDVSNLITDMTIKGANADELAAAVRHSMVVIDAEKHHLDYKKSYVDNNIANLKKKYQGSDRSGASTLISRASSEKRVGVRKEKTNVEKMTPAEKKAFGSGEKVYEYTNETYTKRTKRADGTVKEAVLPRTMTSSKMAEVKDAFELSSGTPMESVYATHANKLKALGNEARKASRRTEYIPYSPEAKKKYEKEVSSLNAKLNVALKNAPLERQAQIFANTVVATKREANPNMDVSDIKKVKAQAMNEARNRVGAKKQRVEITDNEWQAIQAGAISTNKLSQILSNTDLDVIKQLATPRSDVSISPAKKSKAESMLERGYTQAEVADSLGISVSTLSKIIK